MSKPYVTIRHKAYFGWTKRVRKLLDQEPRAIIHVRLMKRKIDVYACWGGVWGPRFGDFQTDDILRARLDADSVLRQHAGRQYTGGGVTIRNRYFRDRTEAVARAASLVRALCRLLTDGPTLQELATYRNEREERLRNLHRNPFDRPRRRIPIAVEIATDPDSRRMTP